MNLDSLYSSFSDVLNMLVVMNIHNTMAGCKVDEDSSDEEAEEHAISRPKVLHTVPLK